MKFEMQLLDMFFNRNKIHNKIVWYETFN